MPEINTIASPVRKECCTMNHKLWQQAYDRLFAIYGEDPPEQCLRRLEAEQQALEPTDAIQVFTVLGKLQAEAKRQNTVIIAAGTIGSSFAAWLMGATVVNPLVPHYLCPRCGKAEFIPQVKDGFDLPPKNCACGAAFTTEGHRIPYQGFVSAALEGLQTRIYTSTAFHPIAVRIVKAFYRDTALFLPVEKKSSQPVSWEEYIVCPEPGHSPPISSQGIWETNDLEYMLWYEGETTYIFDVSPQLDRLEKLGKATHVPLPQRQDLLQPLTLRAHRPSLPPGFPEDLPITCDTLMRIDALTRSAGAWTENGAALVRYRIADFWDIPAFREDIWNTLEDLLSRQDYPNSTVPLRVMERVRKGRYRDWEDRQELETVLLDFGLPGWYLLCLTNIQFLFPKAHGVQQFLADLACTWYRLHHPHCF